MCVYRGGELVWGRVYSGSATLRVLTLPWESKLAPATCSPLSVTLLAQWYTTLSPSYLLHCQTSPTTCLQISPLRAPSLKLPSPTPLLGPRFPHLRRLSFAITLLVHLTEIYVYTNNDKIINLLFTLLWRRFFNWYGISYNCCFLPDLCTGNDVCLCGTYFL